MYIKIYHPKKSMQPTRETIQTVLGAGWVAQAKKNGYRCQIHRTDEGLKNYTRQGSLHTRQLPLEIQEQLMAVLPVGTAVVGEWVHHEGRLYLFDLIKKDGKILDRDSYEERYKLLPDVVGIVSVLPLLRDTDKAFSELQKESNEGLVFKTLFGKITDDNSIIRCRRSGVNYTPERRQK